MRVKLGLYFLGVLHDCVRKSLCVSHSAWQSAKATTRAGRISIHIFPD